MYNLPHSPGSLFVGWLRPASGCGCHGWNSGNGPREWSLAFGHLMEPQRVQFRAQAANMLGRDKRSRGCTSSALSAGASLSFTTENKLKLELLQTQSVRAGERVPHAAVPSLKQGPVLSLCPNAHHWRLSRSACR